MYPNRLDGLLNRMGELVDPLREWLADSPPVEPGKKVELMVCPPRRELLVE